MVTINKVYTRTGDDGTTALGTGARLPKHALRIEAYGTVDELNAVIGLARLAAEGETDAMLERIQNDLFDLGADLCVPEDAKIDYEPLRMSAAQVTWLETRIDALNERLAPLTSFVLPAGSALAAQLHLARTVARRAERLITAQAETEPVGAPARHYINRLSDLFFVAARVANLERGGDVLWTPGANRG